MKNSIPSKLGALFAFRNEEDLSKPLEILVYEDIGKDPWTGEGLSVADMLARLDQQQPNREILMRVNSRGGDVHEGLLAYNRLSQWNGRKVGTIDGVAASIASVMLMACDEVRMPKSSQMFIHDVWKVTSGDEAAHADAVKQLATTSDLLADIYAKKTCRLKDEIRNWMRQSKLMNGEEAKALGFADTLIDGDPLYNFSPDDLHAIRAMAAGEKQVANHHNKQGELMDRSKILDLLNKAGVKVDDKATEEQLLELLAKTINKPAPAPQQNSAEIIELRNALTALTDQRNAERKDRVTRAVHQAVLDDKISLDQENAWVENIMSNEKALDMLNALPSKPPGVKAPKTIIESNASVKDVLNRMQDLGRDNSQARAKAELFNQHSDRIISMMNAAGDNTISAGLQRQVIMQQAVMAFSIPLLPIRALASVFENVPLEGTDKVNVPFYDRETTASTDFVAANGYVIGTTTTDSREVQINKRKYQALSVSSSILRRQPYYKVQELINQKAEKLAADVFQDILSVVTAANYGDPVLATPYSAFDFSDLVDIGTACTQAYWLRTGRSIILDSAYFGALVKDDKDAGAAGTADAATDGIVRRKAGFNVYESAYIPDNSENLKGMAIMPSSILVATAPIMPTEEVMSDLSAYEVFVNPATGMAFEYRSYGDAQKDVGAYTIECNYGYAKGNAEALKRVTSQ